MSSRRHRLSVHRQRRVLPAWSFPAPLCCRLGPAKSRDPHPPPPPPHPPTPHAARGDLLSSPSAACCCSCCSRCVYLPCPLLTHFLFPLSPQYGSHSIVLSPSRFPDRPSAPLRLHPAPNASCHRKKKNSESALSRCRRAPFCLFHPQTERRWSAADSRHLVSACAAAVHASASLQPNSQTQLQMCSPATFSLFCPNLFLCPIANSAFVSSQCFSLRQRLSVKQISPLRTHLQLLGVYRQFAEAADMIRHPTAFAGQIEGETFG